MKKWIIIIIGGCALAASAAIATLSVSLKSKAEMCAELKQRTKEQSRVIDSLLNRRMTVFDVQLHVTDKSRFAIYGRYNKGTINVPNERRYELTIDSTNVSMK
ncbi:MAG: hypothetical protein J6Y35_01725 [Bacteroidales bacterium]|nr:hypothetical protein [Bacteroidales bacterium]